MKYVKLTDAELDVLQWLLLAVPPSELHQLLPSVTGDDILHYRSLRALILDNIRRP